MKFIDYIFYRVYYWYFVKHQESKPLVYSVSFIALFQVAIISTPVLAVLMIKNSSMYEAGISNAMFAFFGVFILILNYYRYGKVITYEKLSKIYGNESKNERNKKGLVAFIAIVLIFVQFFILLTYRDLRN